MKPFGLIVVDKPVGPTSHQVVSIVRRGTGVRKVGHAGTLDPRASGVLVLCIGPATRLSEYLSSTAKRYEARVHFGRATDTYDSDGVIVTETGRSPDLASIQAALPHFQGSIMQQPPPYSAIKIRGEKAYALAREGLKVDLEPREVTIHSLEILGYAPPELSIRVESSAGTYIRSIAHDLGAMLSTGAHLSALRRTKAGPFTLDDSIGLAELEAALAAGGWERFLVPAAQALPDLPVVDVADDDLALLRHGHPIVAEVGASGMARAVAPDGTLVAILESVQDEALWQPRKVFLH